MPGAQKYIVAIFVGFHLVNCINLGRSPEVNIKASDHYWSSARGSVGSYSVSHHAAPFDITQPTWTWHNGLKWSTLPVGTSIDDQKAIYLTSAEGVRKFTADGELQWTWKNKPGHPMSKAAALADGKVFAINTDGSVFGISMETGRELWSTRVSKSSDGNYGHVQAHDGVVITAAEVTMDTKRKTPSCCGPMNHKVVGLNGTDGRQLWTYEPNIPIWNFGSSFVGDGTFIFQDLEGRVHRNRVSDGTLVWKSGGIAESWTDGQANLGNNGIVYGVANYGNSGPKGCVSAYRVSDGKMLWRKDVPVCPNSIPTVGRLFGQSRQSVVIPIGVNDRRGERIDVWALDAETGEKVWEFEGFTQTESAGHGDVNPVARAVRSAKRLPIMTMPNSWGTPTIDGQGTVYVGGTTGHFVALRDADGNGKVSGPEEVSVLKTDADWPGSSGVAIAPGVLATANANSLLVWRN